MQADFPNSPTIGDEFTVGTQTRIWNGTAWVLKTSVVVGPIAGSDTHIIFNNQGKANGSPNLYFNYSQNTLGVLGNIDVSGNFIIGGNVVLDIVDGTIFGTANNQKIGFYGSTPVTQPSDSGETLGFGAGSGSTVNSASTFTGNYGTAAYTINDIVKALKKLGLLAL